MRINNNKINKLIVIMILFVTVISINSSVLGKVYTYIEIIEMTNKEIKALKGKDLDDTCKKFENANSTSYQNSTFREALTKVRNEIQRRQKEGIWYPLDDGQFYYEILMMTDKELQEMSDYDLEKYYKNIDALRQSSSTGADVPAAFDRVREEKQRRQDLGTWNPVKIDYNKYQPGNAGDSTKLQSIAGNVLRIIRNVGIVLAIIALTIIGIKYMVGSIEQKAEYKKNMIPFIIGVIILASSTTFVSIIYDVTTGAFKTDTELAAEGEKAAMDFINSVGHDPNYAKAYIYTELARASEERDNGEYKKAYFITLLQNGTTDKIKNGYNDCIAHLNNGTIGDIDKAISSRRKSYERATSTESKEYYIGYLLGLGDTYYLIEYARPY